MLPFLLANQTLRIHRAAVGDTWTALAVRYQTTVPALQAENRHINQQRQPTIDSTLHIPGGAAERQGTLTRPFGTLLKTAVQHNTNPWQLALQNGLTSPYQPTLYQPVFIPGGDQPPTDLPIGFETLELSQLVAQPGQAVAIRGLRSNDEPVTAVLGSNEMDSFSNGRHFVALSGTGAFLGSAQPELSLQAGDTPLWSQPWSFRDPNAWQYQQLTLTGAAAQIDQASIEAERERLFAIWELDTAVPQFNTPFQPPINNYLSLSSPFGARRSYNGGPYRTYHEGVDYAAYAGTAVYAPAAGTVVIAEQLYVRGGAVIIDHGLGIYTGYYHLSELLAAPGDVVQPGQQIGGVGTTGLSTGNHLHWDLLVDGIWVDAQAWLDQDLACWILVGLGEACR